MFTARYELNLYIQFSLIFIFRPCHCSGVSAGASLLRPGLNARSAHVRIVDKVALGQAFLQVFRFRPVLFHSNNASYSPSFARCSYQKAKRTKPWNLSNSNAFGEIGEHWIENKF